MAHDLTPPGCVGLAEVNRRVTELSTTVETLGNTSERLGGEVRVLSERLSTIGERLETRVQAAMTGVSDNLDRRLREHTEAIREQTARQDTHFKFSLGVLVVLALAAAVLQRVPLRLGYQDTVVEIFPTERENAKPVKVEAAP